MDKMNCWEYKGCSEETRKKCPAYTLKELNGVNHGINGGRSCWGAMGTCCKTETSAILQIMECLVCNFLRKVVKEEGKGLINTAGIFKILNMLPEGCPFSNKCPS